MFIQMSVVTWQELFHYSNPLTRTLLNNVRDLDRKSKQIFVPSKVLLKILKQSRV